MTISDIKNEVINACKSIQDPEIPVSIWELGLIYDIQVTESKEVVVLMTLTAPNCPEAGGLPAELQEKLKEIPEVADAKVLLTFDPPWDKSRLSDEVLLMLGLL